MHLDKKAAKKQRVDRMLPQSSSLTNYLRKGKSKAAKRAAAAVAIDESELMSRCAIGKEKVEFFTDLGNCCPVWSGTFSQTPNARKVTQVSRMVMQLASHFSGLRVTHLESQRYYTSTGVSLEPQDCISNSESGRQRLDPTGQSVH